MKTPVLLSNSDLLKLSRTLIERDTSIRFQAKGFSMRPFIRDGDLITVSPLWNSPVKAGDVVLYKTADDRAIVHRVIRKTGIKGRMIFFIKGDAVFGQSEEVDLKNILGRVTVVERKGLKRKLDTKFYCITGLFFAGLSPFSRWIYPIVSKVKQSGRKLLGSILENLQSFTLYGLLVKKLMKENIHYKIATPDDASSLSLLYRYNQQPESENPMNSLYEQLKNPEDSGYWLVAKGKNKVIGGVTLSESEESDYPYAGWWLFGMKVNWRYRRMGIGDKLTKMAADIAAKHGASEIRLLVFEDARPANNLYRKTGFHRISVPELDKELQEEAKKTSRLRIILAKDIKSWKNGNAGNQGCKLNWTGEDRLLLYCCSTKNGGLSEIGDVDWDIFLEKARGEGVSPLVFSRLPGLDIHFDIPGYVREELKKDYYLSATRNILVFEELKKVLDQFNRKCIQIIVMKGAALAETVYGNPALRPMSDVDLLVKTEDLHRVDRQLKKLGYYPADRSVDDVDFTSTYLTTLDYRNTVKNTPSFHVHWHFVNSTIPNESYIRYIKMDNIWRYAVRTTIADTGTWVMSPHHLLIHLSEHALRVTHSLSKLSYFCDIDRAIDHYGKGLDWDLLIRDTKKFNLNKMVYTALYFSAYFINANIPEDVLLGLKPQKLSIPEKIFMRKAAQNKRTPGMSYLVHFSMNRGLAKKMRFVGRTMFPPKDILAQRSYIPEADTSYRHYMTRIREILTRIVKI